MRLWGLASTVALHLAALAGMLAFASQKVDLPQPPLLVSARLVPQPQKAAPLPAPPAAQPIKQTQQITVPVMAAPLPVMLSLAAPSAGLPAATSSAAPLPVPDLPPSQSHTPVEPEFHAAQPPDRQCADQNIARHYPPLLRERGIEGRVLLRVRVDEQGRAAEVQVQNGSGFRLFDEAAQRFTQGCRFVPARRGEQTLASWVEYPVRFALN